MSCGVFFSTFSFVRLFTSKYYNSMWEYVLHTFCLFSLNPFPCPSSLLASGKCLIFTLFSSRFSVCRRNRHGRLLHCQTAALILWGLVNSNADKYIKNICEKQPKAKNRAKTWTAGVLETLWATIFWAALFLPFAFDSAFITNLHVVTISSRCFCPSLVSFAGSLVSSFVVFGGFKFSVPIWKHSKTVIFGRTDWKFAHCIQIFSKTKAQK